ncbi:MAG: O-antigen ligase family protein [Candidatus Dormibacteraeota bacterium]|nr:O-antigen ligase family protein [Candidatus Dormibacteraeota bacterium]
MRPPLERLGGFLPAATALALPAVFIPIAVDSYILPRAAIVIGGSGLGVGLALLLPQGPGLGRLRIPLIAAAAAALLAFIFSVSWPLSFIGSYTRYESLPIRLSYLVLAAATVWLLRDRRSRGRVIPAFVAGTVIASLWALGQQLLLIQHQIAYRPDGNLGNANLLGALLAMAIPLAVARGLRRDRFALAWWLGVAVMATALAASTSRSGALGALAGCLALAVFKLQGRRALVGAAAAALVLGVAVLAILFSPLRLLNDDPGPARLHLWPDAIHMVAARPLTGWGEDATGLVFGRFLSGDWSPEVDRAHSGPLDIAATQGLLGLAALGWVLLTLVRGIWRQRFSESVAALGAACVGYTVWVLPNFDWAPATGAFWLLAGTAWSGVRAAEASDRSHLAVSEPAVRTRVLRSVGASGLALAVVGLGVMPVLADVWYYRSRLDLAVAADPLQARYHWAFGQGLVAVGSPSRGVSEMMLAASLGETDPQLYVDLGDAEVGLGRSARAEVAYRMALVIDPFNVPARKRLAGMSVPPPG